MKREIIMLMKIFITVLFLLGMAELLFRVLD